MRENRLIPLALTPAHLPREIHRLEPEESCCPECSGELDYLGKSALNNWNW